MSPLYQWCLQEGQIDLLVADFNLNQNLQDGLKLQMKRGGLENIMNFIAAELGRQNVAVVNRRQPPLLPPPLLQILHQRDLIIHINATRRSAYLLVDVRT